MAVVLAIALAVLVTVSIAARWGWLHRRRLEAPHYVSEEEARENAAPLSSAVVGRSRRE